MKQVVQKCQCHFLCCAAVCGDVEHISWRHRAPNTHLWVVFIAQPGALWEILYMMKREGRDFEAHLHKYMTIKST